MSGEKYPVLTGKRIIVLDSIVFRNQADDYMDQLEIKCVSINDSPVNIFDCRQPGFDIFFNRIKPDGAMIHVTTKNTLNLAMLLFEKIPVVILKREQGGALSIDYEHESIARPDILELPRVEKIGDVPEIVGKALDELAGEFIRRERSISATDSTRGNHQG